MQWTIAGPALLENLSRSPFTPRRRNPMGTRLGHNGYSVLRMVTICFGVICGDLALDIWYSEEQSKSI